METSKAAVTVFFLLLLLFIYFFFSDWKNSSLVRISLLGQKSGVFFKQSGPYLLQDFFEASSKHFQEEKSAELGWLRAWRQSSSQSYNFSHSIGLDCRFKANCPLVGSGPTGEVPSLRVFLIYYYNKAWNFPGFLRK